MLTHLIEIIPAILTDSPPGFKELIRKLETYTSRIHIDIADGEFVSNKTVSGYNELREIEAAVKFDVHLMVTKPQNLMKEWFHTHADRFIIHVESDVDLREIIKSIKDHKRKIGLALNSETPVPEALLLEQADFIQFMTVNPGFQGQQFLNEVVDKISAFHKKYPDIMIMSDGGITPETAPRLVEAGVSALVSGSYIVKSPDMGKAIEELKKATSD